MTTYLHSFVDVDYNEMLGDFSVNFLLWLFLFSKRKKKRESELPPYLPACFCHLHGDGGGDSVSWATPPCWDLQWQIGNPNTTAHFICLNKNPIGKGLWELLALGALLFIYLFIFRKYVCQCILGGKNAITEIEAWGVSVCGLNTELIQLKAEVLLALY